MWIEINDNGSSKIFNLGSCCLIYTRDRETMGGETVYDIIGLSVDGADILINSYITEEGRNEAFDYIKRKLK